MKPTMNFQDRCIQNHAYLILRFYHEGENPVPPNEIGFSSRKNVRFRCHLCGLSWQRTLDHIKNHPLVQTCPFCDHQRPGPFYNLATEYPEGSKEWNYIKTKAKSQKIFPRTVTKRFGGHAVMIRRTNGRRGYRIVHP